MAHVLVENTGVGRCTIGLKGVNNVGAMAFKIACQEPFLHISGKLMGEIESL
jgi:hypothetical protein